MTAFIGRRAFITLLGGAAAAWPLAAGAQQIRQVGVLIAPTQAHRNDLSETYNKAISAH